MCETLASSAEEHMVCISGCLCGLVYPVGFFFFFFFFLLAISHLVCFDYHSAEGMQQDLLADGEWETKMHLHTQPACLHTQPWSTQL